MLPRSSKKQSYVLRCSDYTQMSIACMFQESIGFSSAENVSSYRRNEEITHGTTMSRPVSVAKDLTGQKGLLLHNSLTSELM